MFVMLCIESFPYFLQISDIKDPDIWDMKISDFLYLNYIF